MKGNIKREESLSLKTAQKATNRKETSAMHLAGHASNFTHSY
jgi:hypothetical protein